VRAMFMSAAQSADGCSGTAACFLARASVPRPVTTRAGVVCVALAPRVSAGSGLPFQSSFASKARVVGCAFRVVVVKVGAAIHGGDGELRAPNDEDAWSTACRCAADAKSAAVGRKGNRCENRAPEEPALGRVEMRCGHPSYARTSASAALSCGESTVHCASTSTCNVAGDIAQALGPGGKAERVRGRGGGGGRGARGGRAGSMGKRGARGPRAMIWPEREQLAVGK
jgi:hypothetical protein